MRKTILLLALSLNAGLLLADDSLQNTNVFPNEREQASYAVGMSIGHNFQQRGIDLDLDTLLRAMKDIQAGRPALLTPQQMSETLKDYEKTLAANQEKLRQQVAAKNLADSDAFFSANGKSAGMMVRPNGVQYRVVTDGSGPIPTATDKVLVNLKISLLDGTLIEDSSTLHHPIMMDLNQRGVTPGLLDILTHMKAGSIWEAWVPPNEAYGEQGFRTVPPDMAVNYEVQLVSIAGTAQLPPAPAPLTSDIIAVPSAADIKKGEKPYTLTPEEVQKMQMQAQQTNTVK